MNTKKQAQSGFLDSRALLSLALVITGIYLTLFATAKPQALTSGPARDLGAPVARGNSLPRPPLGRSRKHGLPAMMDRGMARMTPPPSPLTAKPTSM